MSSTEVPTGNAMDNSYQSRTGQSEIPVLKDEAPIESTEYDNGGDSDQQLGEFSAYISKRMFANRVQSATKRKPSTATTLSASALVVRQSSLVHMPSRAMRKGLGMRRMVSMGLLL